MKPQILLEIFTELNQDFFKYLPAEIITNILSRLPVRTVARGKCVCKPWRNLLSTDHFVHSHHARGSFSSFAVMVSGELPPWRCRVLQFEDDHLDDVTMFDFPERAAIVGGANGFLLLNKCGEDKDPLYICNPVTRHYVEIPGPKEEPLDSRGALGFGVSRITGQYKVVRVIDDSECYVYTLGTGSWRRVGVEAASASLLELGKSISVFVDGNLYWEVCDESLNDTGFKVTCFDLETECFSRFSAPGPRGDLSIMNDCLCFVEWKGEESVVWVMKEYGAERSWCNEYVVNLGSLHSVNVIKVFENGDMLIVWHDNLMYYCNATKTNREIDLFDELDDDDDGIRMSFVTLTPNFLSLGGLGMENIVSF